MNRIAFRIYDPEKKKFHYSGSTPSMLAGYFKNTATLVTIHGMEHQQGTSLHDKTGREIYEGDIVTGNWYSYEEPTSCVTGIVEYWQGWCAFIIHDAEMKVLAEMNGHGAYHFEFEVIGNVYENPELLKGAD